MDKTYRWSIEQGHHKSVAQHYFAKIWSVQAQGESKEDSILFSHIV